MSGSGGGWDPDPPRTPCDRLTLRTVVNSPSPTILPHVQVDDCLEVVIDASQGRRVVVVLFKAQILGSITVSAVPRLVQCLEDSNLFKATVLSISGARCEVLITPGSCS